MSIVLGNTRPDAIQRWIATNAPGSLRAAPRDSWRAYLIANGGVGKTLRDLESSYLDAAGSSAKTLRDQWALNLAGQSGTITGEKSRNKFK